MAGSRGKSLEQLKHATETRALTLLDKWLLTMQVCNDTSFLHQPGNSQPLYMFSWGQENRQRNIWWVTGGARHGGSLRCYSPYSGITGPAQLGYCLPVLQLSMRISPTSQIQRCRDLLKSSMLQARSNSLPVILPWLSCTLLGQF